MPFIDPSILLVDPQFTSSFQVTQRTQTISTNGEVSTTSNVIPRAIGIVTPTSPADLERLPEMQYGQRAITIITKMRLNTAAETWQGVQRQPDLVEWQGDTYLAKVLLPWTQYGPGWVKVICISWDSVETQT